jgi:hypothetical protein
MMNSNTTTTVVMHRKGVAKTGRTHPTAQKIFGVVVVICLLLAIIVGVSSCHKKAEAKKAKAAQQVANAPATATVEALVLVQECYTPCSSFVGWSYKIRTDGHPLRIKYQGSDWIDYPAEGNTNTPATFTPGETFFESSDPLHPNVRVQVYQKIKINRP